MLALRGDCPLLSRQVGDAEGSVPKQAVVKILRDPTAGEALADMKRECEFALAAYAKDPAQRLFIEVDASDAGWGARARQMVEPWKGAPEDAERARSRGALA